MPSRKGFAEESPPFEHDDSSLASVGYTRLKIDSAGRIVIPAEMRAAMMVKPGDTVTARVVDGELKLLSRGVILHRLHEQADRYDAEHPGQGVVDELIADRREEARREDERYARLEREGREAPKDSH